MRIKRVNLWFSLTWRPLLEIVLGALAIAALLLYRLGTLVPGFSPSELVTRASSSSLQYIIDNPLFAPYRVLQYGMIRLDYTGPAAMRFISVLFAAFAIYMMFYVLKHWHSQRVALMGTVMFAASSWFLHYARLGTPSITYTLLLATLAFGTWMRHSKRPGLTIACGLLLGVTLLYIPGLLWFIIPGIIWQKDEIVRLTSKAPKLATVWGIIACILIAPLLYAIVRDLNVLRALLGLPMNNWPVLSQVLRSLYGTLNMMFLHGSSNTMLGLPGLALLDIFAIAMFVMGIYDYLSMRKLDRIKMLGGTIVMGIFIIALGGAVTSILLAPFTFVIIAAGIGRLLEEWFTVFPRNPLARGIGIGIMTIAVATSCWYQLNRYFVAWPHTNTVKRLFSIKS